MKVTYDNMVAEGDLFVTEVTFDLGAYQGEMEDLFGIPDLAIGTVITRTGIDYARFQDGKIIEAWGTHDELGWFQQFGFELVPPTE
ncbi:MAG TPA: ester cyclase [Caldilineaceae bacterium]|nr:ester cyclase [Caldilineaceae bacterium]